MKCVFISNYYNHHQSDFCNQLHDKLGENFVFIATNKISNDRIKLGYQNGSLPVFVKELNSDNHDCLQRIIDEADVVISGHSSDDLIMRRLKKNKLVFRYQERPYKNGVSKAKLPLLSIKHFFKHKRFKNLFMLSAGAFTTSDYSLTKTFINKAFKFGYFPCFETIKDINKLIDLKFGQKTLNILWAGRLIEYKRPFFVVELAKKLLLDGKKDFVINVIGTGCLEDQIKSLILKEHLTEKINIIGSVSFKDVRQYMKESQVFILTSNKEEGWGAVLNEAMNSACLVISNNRIGSTAYLIQNGINGMTYNDNFDDFYNSFITGIKDNNKVKEMALNAYYSIAKEWNGIEAANRFIKLSEAILNKKDYSNLFQSGPCSLYKIK